MPPPQTLFDAASAQLPLFDDLSDAVIERLALGGFGRGLLTAALRARLRKAGLADMAALARAAPADLAAVRKIGPVRLAAIRAHILDELARLLPGARTMHDQHSTDRRRLTRLRTVPADALRLIPPLMERYGSDGPNWADLALMRRAEAARVLRVSDADLDGIVAAFVRALRPAPQHTPSSTTAHEANAAGDARAETAHAELLRERDREWDEAAPGRSSPSTGAI
ncbi:hypothetical protein MPPM_0281 [Methylorubrum populi]|uniref:Uncharacterized protein n=1 Tax=Methylorubrum populi TaxID=223967 RepID=A0A169QGW0_9HYPH|nr:hypothetical protein MPPM_0281 [Methylorubrum populi]